MTTFLRRVSGFWVLLTVITISFNSTRAESKDYHLIGWVNTFLPGGGELLLGNYGLAALQATIEVSTFGYGYYRSGRSPLTLDGVPEQLPAHGTITHTAWKKSIVCVKKDSSGKCIQTQVVTTLQSISATNNSKVSLMVPLYSDILQEIGLKYHMVNVFNAYREAGAGPMVDKTPTSELFLAPFKSDNLLDPWVWGGLVVSAAAIVYNYTQSINQNNVPVQPLTPSSNTLYAFDYAVMYPVGSAAPEEMFYRGFLQNEFYCMVPSPFFAIPMTTLLYAFSHSLDAAPSAAATGLYESVLAYKGKGALSKGIAFHFWADVMAGISEIFILKNAETIKPTNVTAPLLSLELEF